MSKVAKEWSPKQRQLIGWLAVPEDLRDPPTQRELAKRLKVNEVTLSRWKQEPGLTREAATLAREMLADDLPDIYGALVRLAKAGSFQHIKLALEVAGEHTDEVNLNVSDRRSAIAARLAAIAQAGEGQARNGSGALGVAPHAN